MDTSNAQGPVPRIAQWLAGSGILMMLAIAGMVMIPVSCTCGAPVPHGHSLFELPHHYHGTGEEFTPSLDGAAEADKGLTAIIGEEAMCAGTAGKENDATSDVNYAASNALESQDGATLQAPPSSSFGSAMALSLPPQITLSSPACDTIALPPARTLQGSEPPPETPPPQAPTTI